MARTTRSAATERAYLHFAPSSAHSPAVAGGGDEFDESDIWGAFAAPSAAPAEAAPPPRARPLPGAVARKSATKPLPAAVVGGGRAAHGSLPVNIPDWSKILGDEYHRAHHYAAAAGDWEVDDGDEEDFADAAVIPPHELAWRRRRAASLSVHDGAGVVGRTLKVRDAVWKRTTGFQD
ncbi:unnamed protein product [Urochloa decumbens]|uniref:Uncharacterized protein n=1 Tax=Urochloa decumbens TaxID=240449 RepID=A0ABC8ZVA8_9POAL